MFDLTVSVDEANRLVDMKKNITRELCDVVWSKENVRDVVYIHTSSSNVPYESFLLSSPDRLVIDLMDTKMPVNPVEAVSYTHLEYFPPQTRWIKPEGGLFIWCELPENVDTPVLLEEATRQNVAFIPGVPFFVDESGKNTMRLNFSNASLEGIEAGMKRLGRVISEAI